MRRRRAQAPSAQDDPMNERRGTGEDEEYEEEEQAERNKVVGGRAEKERLQRNCEHIDICVEVYVVL